MTDREVSRRRGNDDRGDERTVLDRRGYVERITASWNKQVESILEVGRLLIEAKESLPHGEWGKMFQKVDDAGRVPNQRLPFGQRTAQQLMAIARDPVISNARFISLLPPSYGTLYRLCDIPDDELTELIDRGKINPEMTHRDADELYRWVRDEGLYLWERIPEAISVLVKFMRKYPDPARVAGNVLDIIHEPMDRDHELDLDDIPRVSEWLGKLHDECRRELDSQDEDDLEDWLGADAPHARPREEDPAPEDDDGESANNTDEVQGLTLDA